MRDQIQALEDGVDIVTGTPGRLAVKGFYSVISLNILTVNDLISNQT